MWSFILLLFCHLARSQDTLSEYMKSLQEKPRDLPLYPVHYSTAWDGPLRVSHDINQLRMHYMLIGINNLTAVAERGQMVVNYFNEEFGTDFPNDSDSVLDPSGTPCCGGAITMLPMVSSLDRFFRVISLANLDKAVKMNNRISTGGWDFVFNADYNATGKVNRLIPAGSLGLWHDDVVRIGQNAEAYSANAVKDDSFPGPLFTWTTLGGPVIFPPSPYDGSLSINCILKHKDLGTGHLTGLFVPQVDDPSDVNDDTIWALREVGTWPSILPANLPSVH